MENDQKSTIWENPSIIFRQSSNLLTLAATNKCVSPGKAIITMFHRIASR